MIYSIADAKRRFSDLVKRAAYKGEVVTVGTRGKPEAALISVEELHRLQELELERDARLLEEAVRRSKGTVGIADLLEAWSEAHERKESVRSTPRAKPVRGAKGRSKRTSRTTSP